MRGPLFLLLVLAACDQRTADQKTLAAVEQAQRAAVEDNGAILCARAGQPALQRDCLIERTGSDQGLILTLRHPDGAFRRLLVTKDGRGVIAADGAQPARVAIVGNNSIQVAIDGDRYQLPATVKAGGRSK